MQPPHMAAWLLRFVAPKQDCGALAGDILERFHEGQTGAWFWRQVLIACTVRAGTALVRMWPQVAYAAAGTALQIFVLNSVSRFDMAGILRWWILPWPLSQLVFECTGIAVLALTTLPVLGAGLAINREFSWASLLRSGGINLVFLFLGRLGLNALLPFFIRPVPGNPYARALFIPESLQIFSLFPIFLLAAWLGCRTANDTTPRPHAATD